MAFYLTHGAQKRAERKQTGGKNKTTFGTKLAVFLFAGMGLLMLVSYSRLNDSDGIVYTHQPVVEQVQKQEVEPEKLSKWVSAAGYNYPGVELYTIDNAGKNLEFWGTIFESCDDKINGERQFKVIYPSGNIRYQLRSLLWSGHIFVNRAQAEKVKTSFLNIH